MTGYEALRGSAAWFELPGRGKIRALGEDRARLLHAMVTNHVQQLQPGEGCYAFFLTAQGRILADVQILCRAEDLLLDTEPETRRRVYSHLDQFIIADDVTLEDVTDAWSTVAVEGPDAERAVETLGAPAPRTAYSHAAWGARRIVRTSYTGSSGFFLFVPKQEREALFAELSRMSVEPCDLEAAEIVRLEHGKARYGVDISERYLAQETNQLHALHFSKGCYLGQEIVERVRARAQLHRRLMPVHLDTAEPPAAGAKLEAEGKPAGEITSAAYSPALGKTVALAYVRMDYKPGDRVSVGDIEGRVERPGVPG